MKVFSVVFVAVLAVANVKAGVLHGLEQEHAHVEHHEQPTEYHVYESAPKHEVRTIIKHVEVPYPVDKHIKIDRPIEVPVDRVIPVDRPYEIIKYIPQPYIVKVQRPVHVPIVKHIPVPQPIVRVQPIVEKDVYAEPQHQSHGWQPQEW